MSARSEIICNRFLFRCEENAVFAFHALAGIASQRAVNSEFFVASKTDLFVSDQFSDDSVVCIGMVYHFLGVCVKDGPEASGGNPFYTVAQRNYKKITSGQFGRWPRVQRTAWPKATPKLTERVIILHPFAPLPNL